MLGLFAHDLPVKMRKTKRGKERAREIKQRQRSEEWAVRVDEVKVVATIFRLKNIAGP